MKSVQVREFVKSDWERVRDIYKMGIDGENATFETDAPDWEHWSKSKLTYGRLVAEIEEKIAGWVALSPYSSRQVYKGVVEVGIYVDPDFQGKGIGSALLENELSVCEKEAVWTVQASIFPENAASLALHQKYGFRVVGRRERIAQLNGKWRDVLLMEKRL
ncbi:phosphinothricin acetyltransferase [Terribacillus aidingensis]|uniref:Phosphinothricin acetyltransferase n=1 Tax=Terribacillus aidingensis TaxID=586416 RepID=A0A285NXI6_9BACI|nr:GNAT family N-acetyltransferase [Terribacillus aidingensis]SNZ14202.1 phosphinothricin acetyltransferase [Terribacillus aidingensis]